MLTREKDLKIGKAEFAKRRAKVLEHLENYGKEHGVQAKAIFLSGSEKVFSNDVNYPFRVDNDFYYLTGFAEPDAALVLDPNAKHPYSLYVRPSDPKMEIWHGFRYGLEGAKKYFAADVTFDIKDLPDSKDYIDVKSFVHKMRSIKSESEIALMRKSNEIAIQAHRLIGQIISPGAYEYEIQAALENVFRSKGARGWSYPPIVAAGKNSCILHYTENNQEIKNKDLVLVDAGCEYDYYASDITRVYSASGQFTTQQQDVYDIVLAAQEKAIAAVKVGNTFGDVHKTACDVLAEGLESLKLIKDKNDEKELKKYYMHGTGHSLGLDVHDLGVADSRQARMNAKYELGMVTTIEPGLYIPQWEIGVRLEDNILVTENGNENFTESLEK